MTTYSKDVDNISMIGLLTKFKGISRFVRAQILFIKCAESHKNASAIWRKFSGSACHPQSMWAERSGAGAQEKALNAQGISRTPLSAPFPLRNPPLRAPLTLRRFLYVTSAHRSIPAHSIFGPLRSVFRSAHTLHLFSIAIVSYLFPKIGLYIFILIIVICK